MPGRPQPWFGRQTTVLIFPELTGGQNHCRALTKPRKKSHDNSYSVADNFCAALWSSTAHGHESRGRPGKPARGIATYGTPPTSDGNQPLDQPRTPPFSDLVGAGNGSRSVREQMTILHSRISGGPFQMSRTESNRRRDCSRALASSACCAWARRISSGRI